MACNMTPQNSLPMSSFTPDGNGAIHSDETTGVAALSGSISITGTIEDGQTASLSNSLACTKAALGAFSYQWYLDSSTLITGETGSSYLFVTSDIGHTAHCRYSVLDAWGNTRTGQTANTVTIAAAAAVIPTISIPLGQPSGATTGTGGFTTDSNIGTAYIFTSTSGTPPIAATLKDGTGSTYFTSQAVTTAGVISFPSITGLTDTVTYYNHYIHTNVNGDSNIITSPAFVAGADIVGAGVIFNPDMTQTTLTGMGMTFNTGGGTKESWEVDTVFQRTTGRNTLHTTFLSGYDESNVTYHPLVSFSTQSLYTRKYIYFAAGWETNWPLGLKTSRYFTTTDGSSSAEPNAEAYMSEKMVSQDFDTDYDTNELYGYGYRHACYNLDIFAKYEAGVNFGNGLPHIRTGHWYKFETWMVLNSADEAADGTLQFWVDGVEIYNNTAFVWRSTTRLVGGATANGWQSMFFGGNYSGSTLGVLNQDVDWYIDSPYLSSTLDR